MFPLRTKILYVKRSSARARASRFRVIEMALFPVVQAARLFALTFRPAEAVKIRLSV
jgi:hypothetical protein